MNTLRLIGREIAACFLLSAVGLAFFLYGCGPHLNPPEEDPIPPCPTDAAWKSCPCVRQNSKVWPFEESIRVPMLVKQGWGGPAQSLSQFVLNIDLAPTILDYAGIAIPERVDGASFVTAIAGDELVNWRTDFIVEATAPEPIARWPSQYVGVHGPGYVYIEYLDGFREYYDLQADPFQLVNLAVHPDYQIMIVAAHLRLLELLD